MEEPLRVHSALTQLMDPCGAPGPNEDLAVLTGLCRNFVLYLPPSVTVRLHTNCGLRLLSLQHPTFYHHSRRCQAEQPSQKGNLDFRGPQSFPERSHLVVCAS